MTWFCYINFSYFISVQTVKNTAPVRAIAGFTRKAGTQISQGFRQIGSAISRSLATTVLRSKTAGAGEGFAVSVMDDRARGEKVNYRKAVIAAAIGALLVTGGSIGLNKAYSTGQETVQAVVKSGAEQAEDSLKAVLRGEGTGDPYDLLRQHGVPTTLTDEEIAAAKAVDLRMEMKGEKSPNVGTVTLCKLEKRSNSLAKLEKRSNSLAIKRAGPFELISGKSVTALPDTGRLATGLREIPGL
ncbi:hypothetical protein X546_19670 [Brevibacillus borstelensis cifa_chp40]|nr:hypothetical protein X546_19670 [Brevibacillus borstelensis cifa_chp40]